MARGNFLSVYLPYCLERLDDGRHMVVNRECKPIGFFTETPVEDRESYPVASFIVGLTPEVAASLSWKGSRDTDAIYLYADECCPKKSEAHMDSYLKKLKILANLKLKPYP